MVIIMEFSLIELPNQHKVGPMRAKKASSVSPAIVKVEFMHSLMLSPLSPTLAQGNGMNERRQRKKTRKRVNMERSNTDAK